MQNRKILNLSFIFIVVLAMLLASASCGTSGETAVVESPQVETQEVEISETEQPVVESPEAEAPEVVTPEVETPEVETPEMESPEVETPEMVGLDGEALVQERCTKCHSLDRVENAMKTEAEWESNVLRMVSKGAELNAEEQMAVIKYLAETYPK